MSKAFLFYKDENGNETVKIDNIDAENETIWLSQKQIAALFDVGVPAISKHIANIYDSQELEKNSTFSILEIVEFEGRRQVTRHIEHYNLDMIIAVGYRVNSYKATRFRQWATQILKEYLVKGFVLDDERLKQGKILFNKDYLTESEIKELNRLVNMI